MFHRMVTTSNSQTLSCCRKWERQRCNKFNDAITKLGKAVRAIDNANNPSEKDSDNVHYPKIEIIQKAITCLRNCAQEQTQLKAEILALQVKIAAYKQGTQVHTTSSKTTQNGKYNKLLMLQKTKRKALKEKPVLTTDVAVQGKSKKEKLKIDKGTPHAPLKNLPKTTLNAKKTAPRSGSEARGRACSVRLQRLLVDAERRSCRLGRGTYTLRRTRDPRPTTGTNPSHNYQCHHCDKVFRHKSVLRKHIHTHLSVPSRDSTQEVCQNEEAQEVCVKEEAQEVCQNEAQEVCRNEEAQEVCQNEEAQVCQIDEAQEVCQNEAQEVCQIEEGQEVCQNEEAQEVCQIEEAQEVCQNEAQEVCQIEEGQEVCQNEEAQEVCQIEEAQEVCQNEAQEVCQNEEAQEVCEHEETGAHVKEEVDSEESAALCKLYAGHQVKDELVLGPVELHRRSVPSAPSDLTEKPNQLGPSSSAAPCTPQELYTKEEDVYILKFLSNRYNLSRAKGMKIWKDAQLYDRVLQRRSAVSLISRCRKLVKHSARVLAESYGMQLESAKKLREHFREHLYPK